MLHSPLSTPFFKSVLREEFSRRCDLNPRYSLRAFSRTLGVDVARLSRVFSDQALPTGAMADRILSALVLAPSDKARFMESLAEAHQKKNSARLGPVLKKWHSAADTGSKRELSSEVFRVISDWYHYAILELTFVRALRNDSKAIASKLGITPSEAGLAVQRLLELGLLEEKRGVLYKTDAHLATGDRALSTPALRKRQRQIIEKSLDSLENDPLDERSHTAMTMAIDPSRLPEAKKMIEEFSEKLCRFLEGGKRTQVYELSVALFPVQKREVQK